MGTLKTAGDRARIRNRDTNKLVHADAQYLALVNGILQDIHQALCQMESNLVYAIDTITTVDGTGEYTPSFSFDTIADDGVWLDYQTWYLALVSEADKVYYDPDSTTGQPSVYYLT